MKIISYNDLADEVKQSVLQKYFQDPIRSLIKVKLTKAQTDFQAIEIIVNDQHLIVTVDPDILQGSKYKGRSFDDDDDDDDDYDDDVDLGGDKMFDDIEDSDGGDEDFD